MNRFILIILLVAGGVVAGAFAIGMASVIISPPEKPGYREGNVRISVVLIGGVVGGFVGYLAADLLERAVRTPPSPPGPQP